ncbi:MAG: adenosine kinase [Actinomycetia bacterium]|nr:adenosine kinase [Actinomycetes bacterium]
MQSPFDASAPIVGIGNAIVDVIAESTPEFLAGQGLVPGSMNLIDSDRADELYDLMGPAIETSGGSAANTMAGLASFGGAAAYIGKVRDDQLGEVFGHDMHAIGVGFDASPGADGPATARSLILVTPDAQRTMNTFLGISSLLSPEDVDADLCSAAPIVYCEGYLWDVEVAKDAMLKAMHANVAGGGRPALTLSDTFCVERHHQELLDLVAGPIDILFANIHEAEALYRTEDLDTIVARVRTEVGLACITRGAEGSLLVTPDDLVEVQAQPVEELVDTSGAGDQYAAGVLHGLVSGHDLATCGALGSMAAAEVISHYGPRPRHSLAELAADLL